MSKLVITKIKHNDRVRIAGKWYRCTCATPTTVCLNSMNLGAGMYFAELTTDKCSLVSIYVSHEGFVITTSRSQRVLPTLDVKRFTAKQIRSPRGATHVVIASDVMKEIS